MLNIGATFNYVVHRVLELDEPNAQDSLSFELSLLMKVNEHVNVLIDGMDETDTAVFLSQKDVISSLIIFQIYGLYLYAASLLSEPASTWTLSPTITRHLDLRLQHALSELANNLDSSDNAEIKELVVHLLKSGLNQAAKIAAVREDITNTGHKPGRFSLIRPADLELLATRAESMARRHGLKSIEAVFEQQIALIFQSFGFLVVPTKPGRESIDLRCFSNDSQDSSQIMVEAKTTKGVYSLPAKDRRALRDYVNSVQRTFKTLPPPSLLIVVGPRPASTLQPSWMT
jgi:hypothetical protein